MQTLFLVVKQCVIWTVERVCFFLNSDFISLFPQKYCPNLTVMFPDKQPATSLIHTSPFIWFACHCSY